MKFFLVLGALASSTTDVVGLWLIRVIALYMNLTKQNGQIDRKLVRRESSDDGAACWLSVTTEQPRCDGLDGHPRAVFEAGVLGSGTEKERVRSVAKQSSDLFGVQPTVTVEAGHSNRRRCDTRPNHSGCAMG